MQDIVIDVRRVMLNLVELLAFWLKVSVGVSFGKEV